MEYHIYNRETQVQVTIAGRLTFNDNVKMCAVVSEILTSSADIIYFDLERLLFIDSAAVGMLLIAREELSNFNKGLVLRRATGQVKRVLTVAQIRSLIALED